jgi:phosphoserine phosphatase RsbU/P
VEVDIETLGRRGTEPHESDRRLADSLRRELAPRIEEIPGISTGLSYSTALEVERVGGDFLDVVYLDSTTAMLLIGDVAGTGVPAAFVAARVRAGIRVMAQEDRSPARILSRANHVLSRVRSHEELVAAFLILVDLPSRMLTMSVAGHPEPIVQCDGRASRIETINRSPLGAFYDTAYGEWTRQLRKGDRLVLYTDGITRAGSASRRYGEDRLLRTVAENKTAEEQHVAQAIMDSAMSFAGGRLNDDAVVGVITLT